MSRANAAILFEPTSFEGVQQVLKGRHVAGASFLDGFVRHADVDEFVGVAVKPEFQPVFEAKVAGLQQAAGLTPPRPATALRFEDLNGLAKVGAFFCPDPTIGRLAWTRRHIGQRAYSICGITHTISSKTVQQALADYLTAPLQPWDAVICTSTAVRDAVVRVQEQYADYMEMRVGARPRQPAQLPVIPLGVDAEQFVARGRDRAARAALRERLGVAENDILVLFLGRLSFHAKVHPSPMYLAMQRAQAQLAGAGPRLHLLMTGQFANRHIEDAFRKSAAQTCPDIPVHFLDGTPGPESWSSWAAADLFLSLSDNIQESFGITPIEAMAAGLPCIVSDWNGYRDTVTERETGFRAPTWMGPAGITAELSRALDRDTVTYDRFIGGVSLVTAVDVDDSARAIATLAQDTDLRRSMAEAGIARARAVYDWSVIIPQYQGLWADLAERRRRDTEIAPPSELAANPALADPAETFGGYPSYRLSSGTYVRVTAPRSAVERLFDDPTANFSPNLVLTLDRALRLFDRVGEEPMTVSGILSDVAENDRTLTVRTVLWLAKFGVFSLSDDSPDADG